MAKIKEISSIKRVGPRYGRTTRKKVGLIEHQQRQSYPCPACAYIKVERVAAGIWKCGKCSLKFASKAYTVPKVIRKKEAAAVVGAPAEEPVLEDEIEAEELEE